MVFGHKAHAETAAGLFIGHADEGKGAARIAGAGDLARDGGQQRGVGLRGAAAFGVVVVDDEIGHFFQRVVLVVVAEVLEMAEADEAGRHAGHHGGGFDLFAPHRLV